MGWGKFIGTAGLFGAYENTGIREYLVSMVIFLIPRFMRVYSFLGSCFWEDNLLCPF